MRSRTRLSSMVLLHCRTDRLTTQQLTQFGRCGCYAIVCSTVFGTWNSGVGPIPPALPTWIEFQLTGDYVTKPIEIARVRGILNMAPPGNCSHTLTFDASHIITWSGAMKMGTELLWVASSVHTASVVRIATVVTPAWAAFSAVEIFGCESAAPMDNE